MNNFHVLKLQRKNTENDFDIVRTVKINSAFEHSPIECLGNFLANEKWPICQWTFPESECPLK